MEQIRRHWRLCVVVWVFGVSVVGAFPVPRVTQSASYRFGPVYDVTSTAQGWAMFAPVPTNTGPSIAAEIHFDDGRIERWEPFDAPDWQMLRDRRWEKVAKSLQGTDRHELWPLFAEALRRRWSIEGQVTDVVLLRTSYEPLKANRQNAEVQLERIEQPFFSMASGILFVNGGAESSMELD